MSGSKIVLALATYMGVVPGILLGSYKYIRLKAITSAAINLALTPAVAFLPLLVTDYLEGGPELLATLQISARSAGRASPFPNCQFQLA